MNVVKLDAKIQWFARPSTTSGRWIGVCEPMNLIMEANGLDELRSLIEESMQLLFADLLEDHELDKYLRDRGWVAHNLGGVVQASDVQFEVPWELIAKGKMGDPERRTN